MDIIQYVKKYGDKSFLEEPFCDVDSFVLSQISYFHFNLLCEPFLYNQVTKKYYLKDLLNSELEEDVLVYRTLMRKGLAKIIEPLRKSKRFSEIQIGNVQSVIDRDNESQFFALTYYLPNGEIYICYRGTDATLVGWKEDLNMAHLTTVPSHLKSVLYINAVLRLEKRIPFYIGGHSKGGNLAYYAAMKMDDVHLPYLRKIYNLDGPGFKHPEEIFDKKREQLLKPIYYKVIPSSSLVGILLHHDEDAKIINSNHLYILQHDLFSWQIDPKTKEGDYLSKRSLISRINEDMMKSFLEELDDTDIKEIADALLEMLGGRDLTVHEVALNPLQTIKYGRNIYRTYPIEKRRKLFKVVALLIKNWAFSVVKISLGTTKRKRTKTRKNKR